MSAGAIAQLPGRRFAERDGYVLSLREAGYTLAEIGGEIGVSRERVRQLLERAGAGALKASGGVTRLDPIAVLRAARAPGVMSLGDVAERAGRPRNGAEYTAMLRLVKQLGVYPALKRLYRWRFRSARRREVLDALRAWCTVHGRMPTTTELNDPAISDLPWGMACVTAFGSLPTMWAALGVAPRQSGHHGHRSARAGSLRSGACLRGHPWTPENTRVIRNPGTGAETHACRACASERKKRRNRRRS
jgi:hypothetical protein